MHAVKKRAKKRTHPESGIQVVVARIAGAETRSTMLPPANTTESGELQRIENVLRWEADPADIHRRPTYRP